MPRCACFGCETCSKWAEGLRGTNRVLRLQLIEIGVGSVGEKVSASNTDSEDLSEKTATITREPSRTPPLSDGGWEED